MPEIRLISENYVVADEKWLQLLRVCDDRRR
jgi:hypothetical protein